MIRVVPFEPDHLKRIDPLPCYEGEPHLLDYTLNLYGAPGSFMYTLMSIHNEVVCVFGGLAINRSMNIWAIVCKPVLKYGLAYHRTMGRIINQHIAELRLLRVQSVVDADNIKALKQHKRWGFDVEGIMRKSGWKGQDQMILAKVV